MCNVWISRRWLTRAFLAGALYVMIGVGFAPLSVPSAVFWRLAAWLVSAVIYGAHIAYEHFQIRDSPHLTALHVGTGAALGAFGLAAAAVIHSLATGTGNLRLLGIALLAWPLIAGLPAYVAALLLAASLARIRDRRPGGIGTNSPPR